jgi:hypothetical protein
MKRSFITFATGEQYEKLADVLFKSIKSFSDYPLTVYNTDDFDIKYSPEEWAPGYIYIYKILSCLKALKEFDEVVWLDTDCIVTANINKIWNNKIDDYPLLPKHRFYNFDRWPHEKTINTDPRYLIKGKNKVGLIDNNFDDVYLQACCMFFNRDCYSFFNNVLSYFDDYDSESFPFGDETIINLLLWKEKKTRNLGHVFLCSFYFSPHIFEAFSNTTKEDYPKIFDMNYQHIYPVGDNDDFVLAHGWTKAIHNRIGLIENNFDDILFFHGSKSELIHMLYLNYMIK